MPSKSRWWSFAVVVPALVGAAWFMTGQRRTAPEPVIMLRRDTPGASARRLSTSEGIASSTPPQAEAEPGAVRPPTPIADRVEDDDQPLREGATQEQIEAKMAKAKVAYPTPSKAAADERDRYVGDLIGSGPGGSQWLAHFKAVENHWLEIDHRKGFGIELTNWKCFKNGCTVTIRASSVKTLEEFSSLVRDGKTTQEWHGAGFRSGPIQTDTGEIEATWIFYAPSG